MYGKIYGKSMAKSMADSRAIPRLISEAKSQKSVQIVMDDIILTSLLYLRVCQKSAVPYWEIDDLGGGRVRGLAEGLAGRRGS